MLLEKFKATVRKYGLFTEGDTLLVAFSGGADSTALLNLLLDVQQDWPVDIFLGHFNHKIRSNADRDEAFVRKVAEEKAIQLYVRSGDVPAYAEENKLNMEEAGRILRYRFLKKTAEQLGDALVATGHTMTDQAETFLMRLFRGSGMKGLSGIHIYRDDRVIRPLLRIERAEIEAYLREKGESYILDESNQDPSFLRNRVRNELLPYLRENFQPDIVPRISRITSLLREEDILLDELTEDVSKGVCAYRKGQLVLDTQALSPFPLAFQRRLVRNFLSKIKKNLRNISYDDVEKTLGLAEGKELHLSADLILKREKGVIFRQDEDPIKPVYELLWDGRGDITIPELQMTFKGERIMGSRELSFCFDDRVNACLDWNRLHFPLKVRNRIEGDRYHPIGAPGRKKLKEVMRSKGIPPATRNAYPVFLSGNEIAWVWGLPVSERHKVTESSREIFVISLKT